MPEGSAGLVLSGLLLAMLPVSPSAMRIRTLHDTSWGDTSPPIDTGDHMWGPSQPSSLPGVRARGHRAKRTRIDGTMVHVDDGTMMQHDDAEGMVLKVVGEGGVAAGPVYPPGDPSHSVSSRLYHHGMGWLGTVSPSRQCPPNPMKSNNYKWVWGREHLSPFGPPQWMHLQTPSAPLTPGGSSPVGLAPTPVGSPFPFLPLTPWNFSPEIRSPFPTLKSDGLVMPRTLAGFGHETPLASPFGAAGRIVATRVISQQYSPTTPSYSVSSTPAYSPTSASSSACTFTAPSAPPVRKPDSQQIYPAGPSAGPCAMAG